MDQQFMRKRKESEVAYAGKRDEETGKFRVVRKHRPSGRQKIIVEDLEEIEAARLRNSLIESSED
jgi:hypothetical protein